MPRCARRCRRRRRRRRRSRRARRARSLPAAPSIRSDHLPVPARRPTAPGAARPPRASTAAPRSRRPAPLAAEKQRRLCLTVRPRRLRHLSSPRPRPDRRSHRDRRRPVARSPARPRSCSTTAGWPSPLPAMRPLAVGRPGGAGRPARRSPFVAVADRPARVGRRIGARRRASSRRHRPPASPHASTAAVATPRRDPEADRARDAGPGEAVAPSPTLVADRAQRRAPSGDPRRPTRCKRGDTLSGIAATLRHDRQGARGAEPHHRPVEAARRPGPASCPDRASRALDRRVSAGSPGSTT